MDTFFTQEEKTKFQTLYKTMQDCTGGALQTDDITKLDNYLNGAIEGNYIKRDVFGLNPLITDLETAYIVATEIGHMRTAILGVLLCTCTLRGYCTVEDVEADFGSDVAQIIRGMMRIHELYQMNASIESENFRNLLLSFAE